MDYHEIVLFMKRKPQLLPEVVLPVEDNMVVLPQDVEVTPKQDVVMWYDISVAMQNSDVMSDEEVEDMDRLAEGVAAQEAIYRESAQNYRQLKNSLTCGCVVGGRDWRSGTP